MSKANSEQAEQVLTLEEAAAFLRVPAEQVVDLARDNAVPGQQVNGEWRFLKKALADWLGYGHYYREPKSHRPIDLFTVEELFKALEQLNARLAALEDQLPRRGSRQAVLRHCGVFREDDDLEARLADARARREGG
ncbi:MAG: helix-turn-helix domain-containing protein [Acetobacteraceae bacterium]|nr:helix-turn-helix domain-containing protein [Acetobacteraceae bacterium]